jgi:hypothetical protein
MAMWDAATDDVCDHVAVGYLRSSSCSLCAHPRYLVWGVSCPVLSSLVSLFWGRDR